MPASGWGCIFRNSWPLMAKRILSEGRAWAAVAALIPKAVVPKNSRRFSMASLLVSAARVSSAGRMLSRAGERRGPDGGWPPLLLLTGRPMAAREVEKRFVNSGILGP